MNPFSHTVAQIESATPPLAARPATVAPKSSEVKPSIVRHGRLITERYASGERLVDIARDMGFSYGGVRGMRSKYRAYIRQGLIEG